MTWSPLHARGVRLSLLFALLGVGVAVREGVGALRYHPVAPALDASPAFTGGGTTQAAGAPLDRLVALAPFSPSRSAAPDVDAVGAVQAVPQGAMRRIGTVTGGDSPFAVCQLGAERPRRLHVGDTLGGWALQRVSPGAATFIDAARARHELRISSPGN